MKLDGLGGSNEGARVGAVGAVVGGGGVQVVWCTIGVYGARVRIRVRAALHHHHLERLDLVHRVYPRSMPATR